MTSLRKNWHDSLVVLIVKGSSRQETRICISVWLELAVDVYAAGVSGGGLFFSIVASKLPYKVLTFILHDIDHFTTLKGDLDLHLLTSDASKAPLPPKAQAYHTNYTLTLHPHLKSNAYLLPPSTPPIHPPSILLRHGLFSFVVSIHNFFLCIIIIGTASSTWRCLFCFS